MRGVRVTKRKRPAAWITRPCPTCGHPTRVRNGALLCWWREQAGLSQRRLAKELGISGPYLSDLETNRRTCPDDIYSAYARLDS